MTIKPMNKGNTCEDNTTNESFSDINTTGEDLTGKKFLADYCKRGSTKCKVCRKKIQKGELRIGKSVPFKNIYITQYYHVKCGFESFKKARLTKILLHVSRISPAYICYMIPTKKIFSNR